MLPTNVMSFMKKMVTNEAVPGTDATDSGNTLSKLRQTLSSSLHTAQDNLTKLTPVTRQSIYPDHPAAVTIATPPEEKPEEPPPKPQNKDPGRRAGTCRVCLKSFKPEEFFKICFECQQKVCEDCASYSKLDPNQDESTWACSICRRKRQSRTQPIITQESTDSLLEVPILEALQRRHSDVKLGSSTNLGGAGANSSAGLAPPRSPELRRHSDVSPASLKEIEKVAGDRREELRWERELAFRHKKGSSPTTSRSGSPTSERRPFPEQPTKVEESAVDEDEEAARQRNARARRKSRIGRQHSYDEEVKAGGGGGSTLDAGLGLPAALPRRASAYDVFAASPTAVSAVGTAPMGRRASFRVAPKQDDSTVYDTTVVPSPEIVAVPGLAVEEDRRTRRRGSQLPDIANIRGLHQPLAPKSAAVSAVTSAVARQQSCDGEAIKIVIDDVDCDAAFVARPGSKRRVVLRKDPSDIAPRTRGFGMRVVGGKASMDGRLFAYIVWTVPGGPAEKAGLQQGDKVLEWCGVPLMDRSFEEVSAVMDRSGDVVELLVEHANDLRMCDLLDDPGPITAPSSRKNSGAEALGLALDTDMDKSPLSPTRRKLPRTPEMLAKERAKVSGRVQIQVSYSDDRKELSVAVLAADDLALREDGSPPEPFAQLRLLPAAADQKSVKTDVAEPTSSPMWNATLEFNDVPEDDLMERTIEVTLWDNQINKEDVFLGESAVDLQKAFMDDRPVWYRLEDPRAMRGGKSPFVSPRGSLATEIASRLMRRGDFASHRSFSDDQESEGTPEFNLLHPDHAWPSGSRRGSSQSEGHLEPEAEYQLGQDMSRSLPGSRRSSFQSQQGDHQRDEAPVQVYVNRGRRRSSVVRTDPEELLKSLKACRGELGRQMSLTNAEKRQQAALSHRRASCMPMSRKDSVPEQQVMTFSSPEEEDSILSAVGVKLGPGQIRPKGHRGIIPHGEVKLGLLMTKGQLEVEVVSARNIVGIAKDSLPDTYIKTYLRDGERWLQKRKTRVVAHTAEPMFKQTLRYSACDISDRSLLVMLWERQKGFEHNQGLGGAELALTKMNLTRLSVGWYPLFPITTLGSDSNDSP